MERKTEKKIVDTKLTIAANGKSTVGCFHSIQHFSPVYLYAYVSVSFSKQLGCICSKNLLY